MLSFRTLLALAAAAASLTGSLATPHTVSADEPATIRITDKAAATPAAPAGAIQLASHDIFPSCDAPASCAPECGPVCEPVDPNCACPIGQGCCDSNLGACHDSVCEGGVCGNGGCNDCEGGRGCRMCLLGLGDGGLGTCVASSGLSLAATVCPGLITMGYGCDDPSCDCHSSCYVARLGSRLRCAMSNGRFGYFCGTNIPWAGAYKMVYPVNPDYRDPRDSGVYAAQGYGIPMSVPLAPTVQHVYNYSWGIPSSRLTPMYNRVAPPLGAVR